MFDRVRMSSLILLTFYLLISGYWEIALAGDQQPISLSDTRLLQQCLADYLIDKQEHPTDAYYHGILEIETDNKLPDKYSKSIYLANTKNSKQNLGAITDQNLNFTCTDINLKPVNEYRPNFLGQAGSWPTDKNVIFKTTCALSKPYRKGNNFLISYICNTITHEAPSEESQTWCSRTEMGSTFYAIFSKGDDKYQLQGIGEPDEAIFAPPPCKPEENPR